MTPEKKIQKSILDYLKSLKESGYPIFYERRQSGGYSYKKGIPDIYCVVDGNHVEIEVKAEHGSLSALQERFRDMCKSKNIEYVCATSVDDIKKVIKKYLHSN